MRRSSSLIAVAVAFVFCFAFASPALALMDDPTFAVTSSSSYNPGIGDTAYWRWQWGNTLDPDITFLTFPADTADELHALGYFGAVEGRVQTTGFIYEMRQLDLTGSPAGIPTPVPGVSQVTGRNIMGTFQGTLKTLLVGSFDIRGLTDEYGWQNDPGTHPGAVESGEGLWGAKYRFQNQFRTENATATGQLFVGVDRTPPATVSGLHASPAPPVDAKGWTESRRVNMAWTRPTGIADNYDKLSGVGGYSVALDGSEITFVTNTAPDPQYEPYAAFLNPGSHSDPQLSNVTIESLPPGTHTVGITTVDRATNSSLLPANLTTKVDYDKPSGTIVWTDGSRPTWHLGSTGTVSVNATDGAGISGVSFYLDSTYLGKGVNKGSGVWSLTRSFSGFSNGSHHLTAVIDDMIGHDAAPAGHPWTVAHYVTVGQTVSVDKSAPKATVTSSSYRRGVVVSIKKLNESATMNITIDGKGFSAVSARTGKSYSQKLTVAARPNGARTRKVRWSVRFKDSVGNVSTYSGSSTVTYWRLDKLAHGQVRLVVY